MAATAVPNDVELDVELIDESPGAEAAQATAAAQQQAAADRDHVVRDVAGVKVRMHRMDAEYHCAITGTKGPNVVRLAEMMTRGVRLGDVDSGPDALRVRADEILARWARDLTQPNRRKLTKPQLRRIATAAVRDARRQLRERAKREAKAEREHARLQAKIDAQYDRLHKRLVAKLARKGLVLAYARLPEGAKPTKAATKDQTRPILMGAAIRKTGRGAGTRWELQVTDTYGLVVIPLEVVGAGALRECIVDAVALKAIEASRTFRVEKDGTVQPVALRHESGGMTNVPGVAFHDQRVVQVHYAEPAGAGVRSPQKLEGWPKFEQLVTKPPPPTQTVRVRLDPALLGRMAAAIGERRGVEVVIDLRACERRSTGERWYVGHRRVGRGRQQQMPLHVSSRDGVKDATAMVMPIRVDAPY